MGLEVFLRQGSHGPLGPAAHRARQLQPSRPGAAAVSRHRPTLKSLGEFRFQGRGFPRNPRHRLRPQYLKSLLSVADRVLRPRGEHAHERHQVLLGAGRDVPQVPALHLLAHQAEHRVQLVSFPHRLELRMGLPHSPAKEQIRFPGIAALGRDRHSHK